MVRSSGRVPRGFGFLYACISCFGCSRWVFQDLIKGDPLLCSTYAPSVEVHRYNDMTYRVHNKKIHDVGVGIFVEADVEGHNGDGVMMLGLGFPTMGFKVLRYIGYNIT
ncbi:hypothetical protein VNO78_25244 [Psophocarpus tetragonolobus]|uniref:Uncharacterized protein n=1 Tax=Psophocarpus tetragonolobus TaxID=3891 RepID=A0AAN9S6S8_PSOTE